MQIQYLGHSCFKLTGKSNDDSVTLVTDPFDKEYGLKVPNTEADIVTVSHQHKDHNNIKAIKGDPYVIDTAGEYEVKNVFIQGIDSLHDDKNGKDKGGNIIYRISIEDMVVTHLGDIGHVLDNKQIELLEGTDILLIPVGGNYTIDAKKAVEVINQIEPRMIIPMHYKVPGLIIDVDPVDKFIKEIGLKPTEEEKLKISKKDLPQEDMELIIFK
ncbi:MAG: MBL fold metallo-hydrolase [Candidatus Falkowbacteria bacterium]